MSREPIRRSLTIYLLSPEYTDPLDVVTIDSNLDFDSYRTENGEDWLLFVRNVNRGKPEWAAFLRQAFERVNFFDSSSASALLLIPNSDRLWAITFGRGRFILKEGAIEERFGLRCALNAIDPDKVRAIDKETFDAFASQARQQAVNETEFGNFGVDVDRDLLYAVTGKPRDPKLGHRLSGKDSLCPAGKVSLEELPEYLPFLYSIYRSDAYKREERFSWVDNIYEIRDKGSKRELDQRLVEKLRSEDTSGAWLALPEVVDWEVVRNFSYSSPSVSFMVDDIHLKTYLSAFANSEPINIISLKKGRVVALDDGGKKILFWSVYKCLYAELSDTKEVYLLTSGHWYKINREIVDDLRAWYSDLPIDSTSLPAMLSGEKEDAYNKRIGTLPNYHLFHGKMVHLPANRGPIEFCDFGLQGPKFYDLVHVKRFGPSSKLSHLFFQGMNSGKLLRTSPEFRKALSASVSARDESLAKKLATEPERFEYRVVFAIASSSAGRLTLPLFSKLSLRQAIRELDGLGFQTSLARVPAPGEERLLKRAKKVGKTF